MARGSAVSRVLTVPARFGVGTAALALALGLTNSEMRAQTASSPQVHSQSPSPEPDVGRSPEPLASSATGSNSVRVKADVIEYDRKRKTAIARGNVDVRYQGAHVSTEFLEFEQARDLVKTDRPFVLTQQDPKGTQTIKGRGLAYNLKSQDATVSEALLNVPAPDTQRPVFVVGRELNSQARKKFNIKDGILSTCEEIVTGQTPHYHVIARELELVQDDYALGWDAWIYVNNRRFFWVPFFWVPLKKRESSVQFGQNDVEGFFVKTSWGYRLNPWHSGTLYTNVMQKKGPALGVSHHWAQVPSSLSLFETYGLAVPDPNPGDLTGLNEEDEAAVKGQAYKGGVDPLFYHGLDRQKRRPFDDYLWHIRHQQRLFETMTLDVNAEDYNIYTTSNAQSSFGANIRASEERLRSIDLREDRTGNTIALSDQRFGVNYDLKRSFQEFRFNRGSQNSLSTSYGGKANWSREGTSVNLSGDYLSSMPRAVPSPPPVPGAIPTALPLLPLPSPTPNLETTTTTGNLRVDQALPENARASWDNRYTKQTVPTGIGAKQNTTETLKETVDLNRDLGWADARVSVDKTLLFQPDPQFDLATGVSATPDVVINSRHVDKLPELELRSKPVLSEIQPFTVAADAGRYFDASKYPRNPHEVLNRPALAVLKPYLSTISRFRPHVDLQSKAHDLGLRSTLDFGGSGFDQRFYSTGDQAYSTTLNSSLVTTYTDWLRQTLTYRRVTPGGIEATEAKQRSNTPFQWDALSLSKVTTLDGEERLEWKGNHFRPLGETLALTGLPSSDWTDFPGNIVWSHRLGYDYERLRYSDYNTGLTISPEPRISATLQSSYHFKEVPHLDFKDGRWNQTTLSLTLRSTGEAFGGNWGLDKIVPGAQFTTQLSYDPDKGKLASLTNDLVASFGDTWDSHWELYASGESKLIAITADPSKGIKADPDNRVYQIRRIGVARDLHDFILSADYDRTLDQFMVRLKMTALNFDVLNLSSNTLGSGNLLPGLSGVGGTLPGP